MFSYLAGAVFTFIIVFIFLGRRVVNRLLQGNPGGTLACAQPCVQERPDSSESTILEDLFRGRMSSSDDSDDERAVYNKTESDNEDRDADDDRSYCVLDQNIKDNSMKRKSSLKRHRIRPTKSAQVLASCESCFCCKARKFISVLFQCDNMKKNARIDWQILVTMVDNARGTQSNNGPLPLPDPPPPDDDQFWFQIIISLIIVLILKFLYDVVTGLMTQRAYGYPWN